jgi:hypothetical protein
MVILFFSNKILVTFQHVPTVDFYFFRKGGNPSLCQL